MSKSNDKILVVDDNLGVRRTLGVVLAPYFEEVKIIGSPSELSSAIAKFRPEVVLLDSSDFSDCSYNDE